MQFKQATAAMAILLLALAHPFAGAAVTPEEATKLQSELTPLGAEKAGNKDGTIPAWDGGYTTVWPGYRSGQPRPDPFASEKPLFQITAKNMDQYADKLSDGVKALLQRFPSYRLDVYPTHRTAAAPQWIYDNTFKNATHARLLPNVSIGPQVEGAYGGIPFPIPRDGAEAMWNHLLAWLDVDKLLEQMAALLQLNWVYAAEAQSSSELETLGPIVAPPAEEMENLHRLARLGNMQRIVEYANYLVQLDERYRPFANQLRSLAKNYESKALLSLVEQYLQSDSLFNQTHHEE